MSAPGSLRWLVGQQVRWQWRALSRRGRGGLLFLLAFVVIGTAVLYFMLRGLLGDLRLGGPLPDAALGPALLAQTFLFTLMVSAAVRASLEALFTRGDLDLLLHSPLPARTVLAARALGVALSGAAGGALLLGPVLLVLLTLASIAASIVGSVVLARKITQPLQTLAAFARRVRDGDYSGRLSVQGGGELGTLAESFEHMLEGIAAREAEILHLAYRDGLSGLPNRALFNVRLGEAVAAHRRSIRTAAVLS